MENEEGNKEKGKGKEEKSKTVKGKSTKIKKKKKTLTGGPFSFLCFSLLENHRKFVFGLPKWKFLQKKKS